MTGNDSITVIKGIGPKRRSLKPYGNKYGRGYVYAFSKRLSGQKKCYQNF